MQSTIKTKDGKTVEIIHEEPLTPAENYRFSRLTFRELYHVGKIKAFRVLSWTKEEPGWYTHPKYGGICKEQDGWYVYRNKDEDSGYGPFQTLFEAKQYLYKTRGVGW